MSDSGGSSALLGDTVSAKVDLGYGIAIAVGILILVSTIMLASYVCIRLHGHNVPQAGRRYANSRRVTLTGSNGEGEAQTTGLDEATLQSYPKIVFNEKHPPFPPQDSACSICLADYKDGEMLRFLPECRHTFHADCIDAWLRLHATCPMCRYSPLPTPQSTPGSTPLSDLIPMARYPLNIRYTIHHNV